MSSPQKTDAARMLSYGEAIHEATRLEMERDLSVFVMGQGVDDARGMFGTTLGLQNDFGPERCFDVPLAEEGMTGVGIGAAMAGMRPIQVHQRMDFMLLCMNQLVNMAAKMSYMFGGAHRVPLVVRGIIGRSWGQGAQHSQAFHSYFMHVPGLKVIAPTTPYDAKGCLIAAIRDDNPVIMIEHRMLHPITGHVPQGAYEVPFGKARTLSAGKDITIVGISHMALECVRAKHLLAGKGVEAEVIDPVSLSPLDVETIAASVRRTGRLLAVDTGWLACGAAGEIVMRVIEALGGEASPKVARMGYLPTPCPTTRKLENLFYPSAQTIAEKALVMVRPEKSEPGDWNMSLAEASEITEFKGPF
ncbi:MAG: alpha-ketoacid dehydrogenase subunit beta [Rhodomicrobium sp.]|nr:alpha-ketoacid dehydrogenase subunit beta [Rhodomicrobium sp.]